MERLFNKSFFKFLFGFTGIIIFAFSVLAYVEYHEQTKAAREAYLHEQALTSAPIAPADASAEGEDPGSVR